ncbi:5-formyltetrahydrofolate cyclo-ligase [Luteolibacter sp. AS25]|uniref:5-formyltetrahydrofolate cyclo-ligase n=1 Tax=Luteolibacter sp. AS25 TaxID=3135776 RepID=UPI00398B0504
MTNPDELLAEYLAEHVTKRHRKRAMREDLRRRIDINKGDSGNVVKEVSAYLEDKPMVRVVAVYSALPGEADLSTLVSRGGKIWVFPKVVGEDLYFFQVLNLKEDLEFGAFGILEPKEGLREYDASQIDLFLCPGLGFDVRGGRIGRGRGFYDRVLSKARAGALKVGVCFGFQLVEDVATEPHDIRMNCVIAG